MDGYIHYFPASWVFLVFLFVVFASWLLSVFTFHIWNSAKLVAPFCVSKVLDRDVGGEKAFCTVYITLVLGVCCVVGQIMISTKLT
jgi:hypothetical protein